MEIETGKVFRHSHTILVIPLVTVGHDVAQENPWDSPRVMLDSGMPLDSGRRDEVD